MMLVGLLLVSFCAVLIFVLPHPLLRVLFVLGILVGIVMLLFAVFYGIAWEHSTKVGNPRTEKNCRVMARYGVNSQNEVLAANWAADYDDFRPHVRLYSPQRGAMEFECALPVWEQCGEGMLGDAVIQGRWLSSFSPAIGTPPSGRVDLGGVS